MSLQKYEIQPCSGIGKCLVTMKRSKRLAPKKKLNLDNRNAIIKIKGSGPGSLTANPMKK
jgi:hypothetical protein